MNQDSERSISTSETFVSDQTRQDLDVADQVSLNDLSSDGSEQNSNKDELEKRPNPPRRGRPDSIRQIRKLKVKNDTSHRDIEKRRRDRINRSLWMLKDLVPAAKNRYGSKSGRLEKAELLELTVEYLRLSNKGNGVDSPLSVITPVKSEDYQETENSNAGLSLPQDLYIAGFKDGVLEVLNQLKKNAFLSDFQAQDIVSRVHARDRDGNILDIAHATGVMDALGLSCDVDSQQGKKSETDKVNQDYSIPHRTSGRKSTDVDSGCQGGSEDDQKQRFPSQNHQVRKRRQNILENYESDSVSSDNSSERSCMQRLSPKRPYLSSSAEDSGSGKWDSSSDSLKKFPSGFEKFLSNSSFAASQGSPLLLPAYALHASGTHYVPVVIPPQAVFGQCQTHPTTAANVCARSEYGCRDNFPPGQPPVLVRNGDAYPPISDGTNTGINRLKGTNLEQDRHQNLSSAPTSVISVGKSSDDCTDDEIESVGRPPSSIMSASRETKECHPKGARQSIGDTTMKNDERCRPVTQFDYQTRAGEGYNPFIESQLNVTSNSVLRYFHNKYSVRGLYR